MTETFHAKLSVCCSGKTPPAPTVVGRNTLKAAASYGESLGGAPEYLQTDRVIHAIDRIRKAQDARDEDKTGAKANVTSLKEPERLDVFLARVCGETQGELCPGTNGKELFHSIKRAGHGVDHQPRSSGHCRVVGRGRLLHCLHPEGFRLPLRPCRAN